MEANECNSTSYTICKGQIALGQHVRISKYKLKFAKSSEQNFSTEIFRISNVYWIPRPVYELEDLNKTPIDGLFYAEELTPVRISKRTMYHIDNILTKRHRQDILEYFVRWRGFLVLSTCGYPLPVWKTLHEHEQRSETFLRDTVEYCLSTYIHWQHSLWFHCRISTNHCSG